MIVISCRFETPIHRSDYSDYVRALQLDVLGWDAEGSRFLLGRIAADQVLISDALNQGMPLFDVCEQDSQALEEAYVALFDENGEFQPELEVDEPADSLIVIWRAVLHPRLRPYLQGVVAAISTLFGYETVVAMYHQSTEMADWELAALGFRRIAGSNLIYRHSALKSDFSEKHPCGMDVNVDFEATASDEEWVLRKWAKSTPNSDG